MNESIISRPINRHNFFEEIRKTLFDGKLSKNQVANIDAFINEFEKRGLKDLRFLAYIFATVYHETGKKMQAIEEKGKGKGKPYSRKVKYDGSPYSNPDFIFYGRGHTQNTWYDNYRKLSSRAISQDKGWDFLYHPELLLQMEPSIWATFEGMIYGLYTGVGLALYFNKNNELPVDARRIINLQDKAQLIADYYSEFLHALSR